MEGVGGVGADASAREAPGRLLLGGFLWGSGALWLLAGGPVPAWYGPVGMRTAKGGALLTVHTRYPKFVPTHGTKLGTVPIRACPSQNKLWFSVQSQLTTPFSRVFIVSQPAIAFFSVLKSHGQCTGNSPRRETLKMRHFTFSASANQGVQSRHR